MKNNELPKHDLHIGNRRDFIKNTTKLAGGVILASSPSLLFAQQKQ